MKRTTERTCEHCGKVFFVPAPSEKGRFCSRACLYTYQREHPEQYGGKPHVTLTCGYCGKVFTRVPSKVRAKETHYCSMRCTSLGRSVVLREQPELLEEEGPWVKTCERCGAEYQCSKPRDTVRRRYCSEDCARKSHKLKMRGENNPNYRHGQNQAAARNAVVRDGRTVCMVCGWDISVDLHHVIPKHKGGRISTENIAILCPNHHRMAHLGLLTPEELTGHIQAHVRTPIG
jgi:hypothetical protein